MSGQTLDAKIVPFRGEYYALKPAAHHLCRNLIYPVPDPTFPFLGVHFTRMIRGGVECGPNAVLAFAREGYRRTDVNLADLAETLTYPGFLKMAIRHWHMGMGELWRSIQQASVRACAASDSCPPSVRRTWKPFRRACGRRLVVRDGSLVDDVVIRESDRVLNVGNTPSPAATASLNISKLIAGRLAARLT